jgi:hypothetical protein
LVYSFSSLLIGLIATRPVTRQHIIVGTCGKAKTLTLGEPGSEGSEEGEVYGPASPIREHVPMT